MMVRHPVRSAALTSERLISGALCGVEFRSQAFQLGRARRCGFGWRPVTSFRNRPGGVRDLRPQASRGVGGREGCSVSKVDVIPMSNGREHPERRGRDRLNDSPTVEHVEATPVAATAMNHDQSPRGRRVREIGKCSSDYGGRLRADHRNSDLPIVEKPLRLGAPEARRELLRCLRRRGGDRDHMVKRVDEQRAEFIPLEMRGLSILPRQPSRTGAELLPKPIGRRHARCRGPALCMN